jgi:hypothetical protein
MLARDAIDISIATCSHWYSFNYQFETTNIPNWGRAGIVDLIVMCHVWAPQTSNSSMFAPVGARRIRMCVALSVHEFLQALKGYKNKCWVGATSLQVAIYNQFAPGHVCFLRLLRVNDRTPSVSCGIDIQPKNDTKCSRGYKRRDLNVNDQRHINMRSSRKMPAVDGTTIQCVVWHSRHRGMRTQ